MQKGGFFMNIPNKTSYYFKDVYEGNFYQEWENEYELKESFPDFSRLIRIDSSPQIKDATLNGNTLTINGYNYFNVLYHSPEDEKIHFLHISEPFTMDENIKLHSDNSIVNASIFCTFVSCKVISQRKIYIKAKNKISVDIKENIALNTPDMDMRNNVLYFKSEDVPMQTFLPPIVKTFDFTEELTIDGSYPSIERIVFSNVRLIPIDLIKNQGSVSLNASAIFKIFYESQSGYVMFSRSVPLTLTVENDDIDENTLLYYFTSIENQSASSEMDNYGEEKIIRFTYNPSIILFRIKETVKTLPTDVFSPTHILECKSEIFKTSELSGITLKPFTIEKIFEIPDTDFSEIYDSSAVMSVEISKQTEQGYFIEGICGISVLGMTDNGIDSVSFTVNFNQIFPELTNENNYVATVSPIQATSMISGRNTITVKVNANTTVRKYVDKSHVVLSSFSELKKREPRDKNIITIYYPSATEKLWDISKEYGVDPEEIIKENKLSFSSIGSLNESIKTIFIP